MSELKTKETPTYAFGSGVWVKLLHRIWWPGIVVDPLKISQELLHYANKLEHIAFVKFIQDNEYEVVGIHDQILLYTYDRKIEFVEKGFSNGNEKVSNYVEVNQLNGTTIDNAMTIKNCCSVDISSNKMDYEDEITKKKDCLIYGIPNAEWTIEDGGESTLSALREDKYCGTKQMKALASE